MKKISRKWIWIIIIIILLIPISILYYFNIFEIPSSNYQTYNSLPQVYKTELFNDVEVQYQTEDIYRIVKENPEFLDMLSKEEYIRVMSGQEGPIQIGYDETKLQYFVRGQTNYAWTSENQDFEKAVKEYLSQKKIELENREMFRNYIEKKFSLNVTSVTPNLLGVTFEYKGEDIEYFLGGSVDGVTLEDRGQEFNFKEQLKVDSWYSPINKSDLIKRFDLSLKASGIMAKQSTYFFAERTSGNFIVDDIDSGIVRLSAERDYKEGEEHDYMRMGSLSGGEEELVEMKYKMVDLEIYLNKESITELQK
jgi:hypothetical protein